METSLICTHRLQPFHRGHLNFWIEIRKNYAEHLTICVLRNSIHLERVKGEMKGPKSYKNLSRLAFAIDRNPLPNWERLRLASIAIQNEPLLASNATVMLRDRPDVDWEKSIEDLPKNRVWVFNPQSDPDFSKAKIQFYTSKGEKVIELNLGRYEDLEGQDIRKQLSSGSDDLSFLPECCRDYFQNHCAEYFRK